MFHAAAVAAALNAGLGGGPDGLVARFDREVVVGQPVRLVETVPDSHRGLVMIAAHTVELVGRFDGPNGQAHRLRIPLVQSVTGGPLAGLPEGKVWFHGLHYDIRGFGRKGTAFTITPSEPGVYEVVAKWKVADVPAWLESPPAVLTVRPAPAKP